MVLTLQSLGQPRLRSGFTPRRQTEAQLGELLGFTLLNQLKLLKLGQNRVLLGETGSNQEISGTNQVELGQIQIQLGITGSN